MCGIVGIMGRNPLPIKADETIEKMTVALKHRGPDSMGFFSQSHVRLGHRRLAIIDVTNGAQPMTIEEKGVLYTIVFNGEIYNYLELKETLIKLGYSFTTHSDTEVLLVSYIAWKERVVDHLVGIFAFAVYHENTLFVARDHLGVKPLFYYDDGEIFRFASEIKSLLADYSIPRIIDNEGWMELYALGPTSSPGKTPFKNIFALPPGHFLTLKQKQITTFCYFELTSENNTDSIETAVQKVRSLLTSIIELQMQSDVGVSTLLSGGLDSSIITSVAATKGKLDTFSIDYLDNDLHFSSNLFQVSRDTDFARLVSKSLGTTHHEIILNTQDLIEELIPSMVARDYPGMADIDGSLRYLATKVHQIHKVVLSGECADELFGGYPWFISSSPIESFPWLRNLGVRIDLLNDSWKKLPYEDYVKSALQKSLSKVQRLPSETDEDFQWRQMTYLNVYWFMQNLLTRKDSQTMSQSLEARVPFADYRLAQYVYNLPKHYKYRNGQEKWLLREAFKDLLPREVLNRKKNPYPKTFHPEYTQHVTQLLRERLTNSSSILPHLFNVQKVDEFILKPSEMDQIPWFGQLMNRPQLIAYLYLLDIFFEKYNIQLETPYA